MYRLNTKQRIQVISALVEGSSIRSTERMTGIEKKTILRLLCDVGQVCADYQDKAMRGLSCKRLQCDEIWAFCYAKEKHLSPAQKGILGFGDVWTWTAICADTKLVPSWLVGKRDGAHAAAFIDDLAGRLAGRVQLTSDGLKVYVEAVAGAFGTEIDYAMLIKLYENDPEPEKRYSPAKCCGIETRIISGAPDEDHISTSFVERQNLTMRMGMRRMTRLTNGFSKKVENLEHAVALHFMHYNFIRLHKTLRVTPAMAAGVTDRLWSIGDLVRLLEEREAAEAAAAAPKPTGLLPIRRRPAWSNP